MISRIQHGLQHPTKWAIVQSDVSPFYKFEPTKLNLYNRNPLTSRPLNPMGEVGSSPLRAGTFGQLQPEPGSDPQRGSRPSGEAQLMPVTGQVIVGPFL